MCVSNSYIFRNRFLGKLLDDESHTRTQGLTHFSVYPFVRSCFSRIVPLFSSCNISSNSYVKSVQRLQLCLENWKHRELVKFRRRSEEKKHSSETAWTTCISGWRRLESDATKLLNQYPC